VSRLVAISGCSSGGKSSLLQALHSRGYQVVEEPGRRIIAEERLSGGTALPWTDPAAFVRRLVEMSLRDIESFPDPEDWVFFDRGLVDAASALSQITGESLAEFPRIGQVFHHQVFLAPPWPAIYVTDDDRRHPISNAIREYDRLLAAYPSLGYDVVLLPKTDVEARADFVLRLLRADLHSA